MMHEAGWNQFARNPGSGAYGIPQALPPGKMGAAANPPQSNPAAQISWMIGYIRSRYGDPIRAWAQYYAHPGGVGYYARGTMSAAPGWGWVGERGPELLRFRGGEQVMPAMAGGGNTYNITVNVPPSASKADTGRVIVEHIRAYEQGSGKGWRK